MKASVLNCYILSLLFLLFYASCKQDEKKDVDHLFSQAEKHMESNPDSALMILSSIQSPEKLNNKDYATYLILCIQAKDKNYLDIDGDTLIHVAVKYFSKHKDPSKTALAYFYAGRIDYLQKKGKIAIEEYLKAKEYAEKSGTNDNLLGLIHNHLGLIYKKQSNYDKSIACYKTAKDYFEKADNIKNATLLNSYIGNVYILKREQPDSVLHYFNIVLSYAREKKDSTKIAEMLKSIGVACYSWEDYPQSLSYLKQSIATNKADSFYPDIYKIMANNYFYMNQADSALIYAKKLFPLIEKSNDPYDHFGYYYLAYRINKKLKNYEAALTDHETLELFKDSIHTINRQEYLDEIQKKYEKSQLQNQYDQAQIRQQSLWIIISISLIVIILMAWVLKNTYQTKSKMAGEIERTTQELDESLSDRKEQANELKQYLIGELDILKKTISIKSKASEEDKKKIDQFIKLFGKNLYQYLEWDEMYALINKIYDGFIEKLKQKHPDLNENDIKMCCLIRAGLKNEEIAFFLGNRRNTIDTKKSLLKDKMGFLSMEDFKDYLYEL